MNKTTQLVFGILVVALLIIIGIGTFPKPAIKLFGSDANAPLFSAGNVINSSTSVTFNGQTIITNASNTGLWFKIRNNSSNRVFCGAGTNTSTIWYAGQYLAPVGSTTVTGTSTATGDNTWEMFNMGGAISCIAEAASNVPFSYVGK